MQNKTKIYLVIGTGILALIIVFISLYYQPTPTTKTELTEIEQVNILEELAKSAQNTPPLSEEEQAAIIKALDESNKNTPPLTDEEMQVILESLNQ